MRLQPAPPMEFCETCGHPLLPAAMRLSPTCQRIYDVLRRRPDISAEALRVAVWSDGGPLSRQNIYVQICNLNRQLAPYGLVVRGSKPGSAASTYRIHPLVRKGGDG